MARTGESLKQLAADIGTLVRDELRVAKEEMAEKAASAGIGAGMLGGSAVAAVFTLASLSILIGIALSLAIPPWGAALIVTSIWAAVTAVLALLGKRKVREATPFVPEQTIENVKEDVAWAASRTRSQ